MKMKHGLAALMLLWSTLWAVAQVSTTSRWTPPGGRGYVTLGLNTGWSYQSSDVKTRYTGWGVGMTLAKNLAYQPGGWLAVDLRGRALYHNSFGLGVDRSFGIANNEGLNGLSRTFATTQDYVTGVPTTEQFVYQNYRTDAGELAAELIFTFNRLREKTNVLFSLYGGLGLDGYYTRYDQFNDATGTNYASAYQAIDPSQSNSSVRRDLINLRDGKYETLADNYSKDFIKFGLMPAVGFELGYQLTRRFSVTVGHKFTFTRTDDFDGQRWKDGIGTATKTTNNDLHHYTSLGLNWIVSSDRAKCHDPEIEFRDPAATSVNTASGTYTIRASTKNVRSAADLTLMVNGFQQNFNYNNGGIVGNIYLQNGRNEVVLRANNECGSDQETRTIIYSGRDIPPVVDPVRPNPTPDTKPDINITEPNAKKRQTTENNIQVLATVTNLNGGTVEMFVNGTKTNDFTLRGNGINANVPLNIGVNTVRFVAQNSTGSDQDQIEIRRITEDPSTIKPDVEIVDPNTPNATVGNDKYTVRAVVRNVNSRNEISVTVDGSSSNSFTYDASTKALTIEVVVPSGRSTIVVIRAANAAGSDEESVSIKKLGDITKPMPPVVNIIDPANGAVFATAVTDLRASVQNVENRNDITVYVNGAEQTSVTWDNKRKQITGGITLQLGTNTIKVRARNSYGTDEATTTVIYKTATKKLPTVVIQQPLDNSTTSTVKTYVRANTTNVASSNDIDFRVNGVQKIIFDFNEATGAFDANIDLKPGANTIVIRVTNPDGNAEDVANVTYNVAKNPPVVTITTPNNNSTTTVAKTQVRATVTRITFKSDVELRLNGTKITNFDFNSTSGILDATVTLRDGSNNIEVRGTNADGTDAAQVTTMLNTPVAPKNPPSVTISQPANGSTTTTDKATLRATITNIPARGGITVTLNGAAITTYNFNPSTGVLDANVTLKSGSNTFTVRATNADGTDEASANVTYNAVVPVVAKPDVTITAPKSGTVTPTPSTNVTATITNVTKPSDVTYTVNGVPTNGFTLKGTSFTATTLLKPGVNTITIRATNTGGSDEATTVVTYEAPKPIAQKPTVSFVAPKKTGTVSDKPSRRCVARVTNITDKKEVAVTVNGAAVKSFQFDATNGEVSFVATLKEGANPIVVTATNTAGSANANTSITYNPAAPALPIINVQSVSQPVASPFNPNQASTSIIVSFENVTAANQITLTINGTAVTGFAYNTGTSTLTHTAQLPKGTSTIVIKATTPTGSDTETRTVSW